MPTYRDKADPAGMKNPKAPMYIVAGGPGNIEGLVPIGKRPDFTAFAYAEHFSYASVRFEDEKRLRVEFVESATGEVLDSSVLFKEHDEQFVVQG